MLVYYLRSKSVAQRNFVTFLRRRLVLAAQDKEFLLRHISEVSNGGRLIFNTYFSGHSLQQ